MARSQTTYAINDPFLLKIDPYEHAQRSAPINAAYESVAAYESSLLVININANVYEILVVCMPAATI